MENTTKALIMAAGKGSRMASDLPKMLHEISGKTMISHVFEVAQKIDTEPIVVIGHKGDLIKDHIGQKAIYAHQKILDGSGSAVLAGLTKIHKDDCQDIIVLSGDKPFVTAETLHDIIQKRRSSDASIALGAVNLSIENTTFQEMFAGTGRILFDHDGNVTKIVEKRDATPEELLEPIRNISFYCFKTAWLKDHINQLDTNNDQKEFNIVQLIEKASAEKKGSVQSIIIPAAEGMGVNTQEELSYAENHINKKTSP